MQKGRRRFLLRPYFLLFFFCFASAAAAAAAGASARLGVGFRVCLASVGTADAFLSPFFRPNDVKQGGSHDEDQNENGKKRFHKNSL
jgi:hypothetical protein